MDTGPAASAAREILVRLHDVMASRTGAQAKLNQVVQIIGEALTSEVCSIYLLRAGALELFATRGLKQEAVHVTKLQYGEGLTGTIAEKNETLNLAEATSHPDFAYKPETGEDLFHSFAGVPIVRAERAIGVLTVQHVDPRRYDDVEIEALQTVAMVLAELIAGAGLVDEASGKGGAMRDAGTARLSGLKLVDGMGAGRAVFHQPRVVVEHTVAEDIEAERHRVYSAFDKMRDQIDRMMTQADFGAVGEHQDILATYKMFAYDEGWRNRINAAIDSGLTAEAAIERVQQRTRMRMREIDDPLLADRMHDLEDLSNRLLRIVSGQLGTAAQLGLRQDSILIARNLGPAELLEYDRRRLKGVILQEGSLTSHVVIVARAMGIPVLGRVREARRLVAEGDLILLDAADGTAVVRPSQGQEDSFETSFAQTQKRRAEYAAMRDLPPSTLDGQRLTLMVNAGLREDVSQIEVTGADGIGLFRTEFEFLVSAELPKRDRQVRVYRDIIEAAGDKPVIFRTIDVGGDKVLPYLATDALDEENPAMGWRAIRLALDRDALLKVQAAALIEASGGRTLHVMFPMVSEPWEYDLARDLFEAQRERVIARGKQPPTAIRYGTMPGGAGACRKPRPDPAAARPSCRSAPTTSPSSCSPPICAHPKLAERYDWLSPSVLRFIARVVTQTKAAGVAVGVCGEMGGRPLEAMALIGLGLDRLSITPAAVGSVKAMIRSLDLGALRRDMPGFLASPPPNMRAALLEWANVHGVRIA